MAIDLISTVPWLSSECAGRLSPTLTRFANATTPWSVDDVTGAIRAHQLRHGMGPEVDQWSIRTRPAALLAHIMRELHPETDHPAAAGFPGPESAHAACGGIDCDHGWLETPDGRVMPCPDCPPQARSNHTDPSPQTTDDQDPPF